MKVPWVEALATKRAEEARLKKGAKTGPETSGKASETTPKVEVDLTPKKMSDSYFRTVSQCLCL